MHECMGKKLLPKTLSIQEQVSRTSWVAYNGTDSNLTKNDFRNLKYFYIQVWTNSWSECLWPMNLRKWDNNNVWERDIFLSFWLIIVREQFNIIYNFI
jgi:hypothetical protein